jgi:nucleotide-binding universal stress UspA family protein
MRGDVTMQIKTILVHMTRSHDAESLMEAACALARKHNAHLIGMAAFSAVPPVPPMMIPYSGAVIQEMQQAAEQSEQALKKAFDAATHDAPFVSEWVHVKGLTSDLANAVIDQARAADIIVAAQRDPDWELGAVLDFPEQLALESGRPVFLVPRKGQTKLEIEKVAIAWNGSREATRAAFDALPFLTTAKEVTVLTVTEDGKPLQTLTPAIALAATLARHGVETTITNLQAEDSGVSKTLLNEAARINADLLVLGAYGHSRFREFVFGGVTRDITNEAGIPLLLSH